MVIPATRPGLRRGALLLAVLALAACDDGSPDGTRIPATGGTVTADSGRLDLTIPAGALSGDARIAAATASAPDDPTFVAGSAYDLSPADLQFATPATITLRPRGSLPTPGGAGEWAVALQRNGSVVELPATLSSGSYTAQLPALGRVWVRRMHVARVTLDRGAAQLDVGKTLQLGATLAAAGGQPLTSPALTWASDNAGVATVSATGLVTALGAGTAHVTARSEGREAAATVTVVRRSAFSVEIVPRSLTAVVGEPVTLAAVVRDSVDAPIDRAPAWSSSDASVATVSASGVVTPVAPGVASIVATADAAVGSATLIVHPVPVRVTGVVSMATGEAVPLGEVTGSVAVSVAVSPDRPTKSVSLALACPGRAEVPVATHPHETTAGYTYAFAMHTAAFDAQTGLVSLPNGACDLVARLVYADGTATRSSAPVRVTLANPSYFMGSYAVSDAREPVLGVAPASSATGSDNLPRVAGAVTLRLVAVNYAPGAAIASIGGTFLGRTFSAVAPDAGTHRFTIAFPNVGTDTSALGIAGYTSPAEGDVPAITTMAVSSGPTFTTVQAGVLRVDDAPPRAPSSFVLDGATAASGSLWVPGTYTFDRAAVFATRGDTTGGVGLAGRAFYGQRAAQAGLPGGSATGAACASGTLVKVTTAADLRALRPASQPAALPNEFRLRAVEWDELGNLRCTELSETFGVLDP